jgi:hypothetical protein
VRYAQIEYVPEEQDPSLTIETRDLVARVIDNTGLLAPPSQAPSYFNETFRFTPFTHHLGYHGIRTFYHRRERRNVVVPFVSWLNLQCIRLEGVEADPVDERAAYGVGRGWPLRMERAGAGALIRLDPLPAMQMRYSLELQPAEPDGIDFRVRFELGRRPASGPCRLYASWPCYVNAYDDVRLFYPRGPSADQWEWSAIGEKPDIVIGEPVCYRHEQRSFLAEQQALPVGYGRIGRYALILMFSDPRVNLFLVNAGGHLFLSPVQNPAFDFCWSLEDYPLRRPVGFDGRLVYTRFRGAADVLRRYRQWAERA